MIVNTRLIEKEKRLKVYDAQTPPFVLKKSLCIYMHLKFNSKREEYIHVFISYITKVSQKPEKCVIFQSAEQNAFRQHITYSIHIQV